MIECVRRRKISIVRRDFQEPGVHFFTPADYSQQLGYMRHPARHVIEAHVHNPVPRAVHLTREALFLRRGRLRVAAKGATQQHSR
jgi:hypothetical protein